MGRPAPSNKIYEVIALTFISLLPERRKDMLIFLREECLEETKTLEGWEFGILCKTMPHFFVYPSTVWAINTKCVETTSSLSQSLTLLQC